MVSASHAIQHREVAGGGPGRWSGGPRFPSLNVLLGQRPAWRNDHNGFSHQGPGLIQNVITKRGSVVAGLPATGCEHPAVGGRSLPPQPRLRQP